MQELRTRFAKADPRYGPVPFWWWSAEEVTAERIRWQLQKFRDGGLRNIGIINIAPTGPQYGSVSDDPPYFSERWWTLFEAALREAERLGMRLYFYDQIGFSGSNFPARIVTEHPEYAGHVLRRFAAGEKTPEGAEVLLTTGSHIYASVRQGFNWLDPAAAALLFDRVHGEFERRFPHDLGKTIAGSFQDELPPLPLWTCGMPGLYRERYGEDLITSLPAMFEELPFSATVRRRVYEIAAELAERALFIPLSEWHDKYDMLLCCDQAGPARRADVHGAQRLYLDYFRTHRWYNASGSDGDGEIKPHSSMVHLHGGKRVFLEAFHTSGWGGTLEETMHWLIPWLQAGATLYSPHSVYYSTRGGWWEWAPPDTGWRQPYYEHYPIFADTVSRVCSLLSEGTHVADIAVHYPSHAVCGYMSLADGEGSEHPMAVANRMPNDSLNHIHEVYQKITGRWNRRDQKIVGALREVRLDYDIADDSALEKGVVAEDGKLQIAGERFSILVLCGTTVMDDAARGSVGEWIRRGGFVIGVEVPDNERDMDGVFYAGSVEEAVRLIGERLPKRIMGQGMNLHRRTDDADIFLLLPDDGRLLRMHEPASEETGHQDKAVFRLRTSGTPELWDPVTGETRSVVFTRDGEWVEAEVSFTAWPAALLVCPFDAPAAAAGVPSGESTASMRVWPAKAPAALPSGRVIELPQDGWRVVAVPTLDNRYGDFDLHGENTNIMPTERRVVKVRQEWAPSDGEAAGWHMTGHDDSAWTNRLWSEADYWLGCKGDTFDAANAWPIVYSNTLGDFGFRSWAGRMGRIPRRFLNWGKIDRGAYVCGMTNVIAPAAGRYWIRVESNAKIAGWINGQRLEWRGGPEEQTAWTDLREGGNEFILQAQAVVTEWLRAAVEVNEQARPALPKWIYSRTPSPDTCLARSVAAGTASPVRSVRMVFAARGRAALCVNGTIVTEHGDFNPYIRQGQEEVDVTALWLDGDNEIKLVLPEGAGEVLADGIVEHADGSRTTFCTGEDWLDERGNAPAILHEAVLEFAETETLWLSPQPHPLPNVGWLMPDSVPNPRPLPFHHSPDRMGKPVWLRFPMPVGTAVMRLACRGNARVWIDGREETVKDGRIAFAPRKAGAQAAIRIMPEGPWTDADVLLAPIRFETVPAEGSLGDWRTALCLPHHSGAVEYETAFVMRGSGPAIVELGHVRGSAEVWLDGQPLGVRVWRPYRFELGAGLSPGVHRLRIRVLNTLGTHYEAGRPTSNVGGNPDTRVTFWSKEEDINPRWPHDFAAGGLYGPVRVYES